MNGSHILNLGAGVQSTTLYLMGCRGEIHVDVAIFADTGDEPKAVYAHLEWLKSLNRSCLPLVQIEFKPKTENERQVEIPFWRDCLGVCGV
jgi:hypothetical protein